MLEREVIYPSYEQWGQEIVDSADVDSLDTVEALSMQQEEGRIEDVDIESLSERELRMIAIEEMIRSGAGVRATMFGIRVEINALELPPPPPRHGPGLSGDREPRNPIIPPGAGTAAVETSLTQ